jgi:phosphoserine aminotransferase
MTHRVINFYAGPAGLPLEALKRAQDELLDFAGTGMSVMEISHRSKEYDGVHEEAIALTKDLMGIPENYKVLLLQGGAHLAFGMIPLNLMRGGRKADYITTGNWAEKAYKEANQLYACPKVCLYQGKKLALSHRMNVISAKHDTILTLHFAKLPGFKVVVGWVEERAF